MSKSSFRRSSNFSGITLNDSDGNSDILHGVKPWINCGLGLVSTGLRELDSYLGGGLSLGTMNLLVLDK
jgi:hypothetical protein